VLDSDLIYWLALNSIEGIGPAFFTKLVGSFGSPKSVFQASLTDLEKVIRLPLAEAISRLTDFKKFEQEIQTLEENNIVALTYHDADYPARLRQASGAPPILYVKGDFSKIPKTDWLGVVGSRKISSYGSAATKKIVSELVRHQIVIVSGFALGVDITAHLAAIENGGTTIAVIGSGLKHVYPPSHARYVDLLLKQGVFISEFPYAAEPRPEFFPRRNRIISGLSRGILVVEAAEKSGALITADYALDQNRDVFAVPGPISSPVSAGPHKLIQQGAKLVTSASDILAEWKYPVLDAPYVSPIVDPEESAILHCCRTQPVTSDEIVEKTGLPPHKISMMITKLELDGKIKSLPGRRFQEVES